MNMIKGEKHTKILLTYVIHGNAVNTQSRPLGEIHETLVRAVSTTFYGQIYTKALIFI